MGLLDQVIGGVVGQVLGGGRGGGAMSPVVKALLMLLIAKGASGGLGNIFGGGHGAPHEDAPSPRGRAPMPEDDGDLGGFGQGRARDGGSGGGGGEFGDLAGMLDGPGDRGAQSPGRGPYAGLDREPGQDSGGLGAGTGAGTGAGLGGGLDGLIQSFQRGGLGDVIGSWVGHGQNQPVPPDRLAGALGPDTVDTLSRQTGLGRDDLLAQLSQALPGVIDALTPHGRPPNAQERQGW